MIDKHQTEDERLTKYVLENYVSLCTQKERDILLALSWGLKATTVSNPIIEKKLREDIRLLHDPTILKALEPGSEAVRIAIRDRILRDHSDAVHLERCPKCKGLFRTPAAQMCVDCGYSWHTADKSRTP